MVDGKFHRCLCKDGYIQTGYTLERFDQMQTDADELLLLVVKLDPTFELLHAAKVEAARSRKT